MTSTPSKSEGAAFSLLARNWIGGEWVDADRRLQSINPATGEVIGTYADAGAEEARSAVAIASDTFRSSEWRWNRQLRASALNEMADAFDRQTEDLVDILKLENGKVDREARFEVAMVAPKLRFYAALALTEFGHAVEVAPGRFATVHREAIGVAGIVAPWNSPLALFIRSLAPALAAGCAVVGKLPGWTAQTNARMFEVFSQVRSLPRGVLNVFSALHSEAVRVLVSSPDVPAISYTGSTDIGREIAATGARHLKVFGLELGGKTPILLFDDADLDRAIPAIEKALTVFAGQFCMTGSRLLVQRPILAAVRERLAERLREVRVGPAADPASDMGPLINRDNVSRVDGMVEAAIRDGAQAVVRGGPATEGALAAGAFYRPTLLEIADHKMAIAQEEVFGPVLVMQAFDTEDEAIRLANHSTFGLAASVWSRDVDRPRRVARLIDAGTVWINNWAVVYSETEEGGFKQSGLGRLNGKAALDGFTQYKTVIHEIDVG